MSDAVVILYGSRARGDAGPNADVDLMLATGAEAPQAPMERMGVSLHRYPRAWLVERAWEGDLFAYHVGHEGVSLQDDIGFLQILKKAFKRRASYVEDVRNGLLVARLLVEKDWGTDEGLRRRFFWGVRTCLISLSAAAGPPVFSGSLLEASVAIDGLADLLSRRTTASFAECRALTERLESSLAGQASKLLHGEALRAALASVGGYPAECALASERRIWEDEAIVTTYA